MPWFPQREAEKGGRQEHQPRGESSTHQAADESFVCGQELRWAEEGLWVTEDSQSATGFGGHFGDIYFNDEEKENFPIDLYNSLNDIFQ